MKSIIIDPGHGGTDSGAVGFGVLEKDWNLKISLYQFERLKDLGAKVALSRTGDETLASFNRVSRIKDQYDICISNHWNAFNGQARGVETIHSYKAKPDFARKLANRIVADSGLPLRRVFSRKTPNNKSDYYFMHRLTGNTRTVIIEYGFIDHKLDNAFYSNDDNFYRVAEGVIKVICEEIGVKYQVPSKGGKVGRSEVRVATDNQYAGKRLVSIHRGNLRFYKKPSWDDKDVYGHLTYGLGFRKVVRKLKVGRAYQYEVENAKGERYFITASPKYVRLH